MQHRSTALSRCAFAVLGCLFVVGCKASSDSGGGAGGGAAGGGYCEVKTIIDNHCLTCHGAQPIGGAPMSLLSWNDLMQPAKSNPALKVVQLAQMRIHDVQRPMPQPPFPRLNDQELAAFDAYLAGGAQPPIDPTCGAGLGGGSGTGVLGGGGTGVVGTGGTGVIDNSAGTGAGGDTGSAGAAGSTAGAGGTTGGLGGDWPADCEEHYVMTAHGVSGATDTSKFNVSAGSQEFYQCFFFKAPWGTDEVQALAFKPIIDDTRVVHHWILYGADGGNGGSDGQVGGSGCASGAFISGWAPGGQGSTLPADVGLQMPKGSSAMFGLQIHYNNLAHYTDSMDKSGVEFCVTRHPRTNTAAVHWLGQVAISLPPHQSKTVTGQCTPSASMPVHLIGNSPHMHKLGTHATLVINRKGGGQTVLHDDAFDFANQTGYALQDVMVMPGDTLTTTCVYNNTTDNTVTFGENTENEMCFNFVTAWPLNQLVSSGGGLGGLFGGGGTGAGAGSNRCMN